MVGSESVKRKCRGALVLSCPATIIDIRPARTGGIPCSAWVGPQLASGQAVLADVMPIILTAGRSEGLGEAAHDATLGNSVHLLPRPGREPHRLLFSAGFEVTPTQFPPWRPVRLTWQGRTREKRPARMPVWATSLPLQPSRRSNHCAQPGVPASAERAVCCVCSIRQTGPR